MRKILIIYFLLGLMSTTYATSMISIKDLTINLSREVKAQNVTAQFEKKYGILEENIYKTDKEKEEELTNLVKKTTYLILGKMNNNETENEYISRKQEYYRLRYIPKNIPKDSSGNYITSSQEYKDDIVSGLCIPQMFTKLNSLDIKYDVISSIKINERDDFVNAKVLIKNVTYNAADESKPREIVRKQNDMVLDYLFKWDGEEYKLYYYTAMFDEELKAYFDEFKRIENEDNITFNSKMLTKEIERYDLSKLYSLPESKINEVYNNSKKSVVMLNAIYEKSSFYTANAFCIEKDYFVTTWDFIEKALLKAQFINIVDCYGNSYEMEGIVYANSGLDFAIIKVNNTLSEPLKVDNTALIEKNDPVIIVSSKTGYTLSTDAGIIIDKNKYITNLLMISEHDGGSPILDSNGNLIGMNNVQFTYSDLSLALPKDTIYDIWEKVKTSAENNVITFEQMKEQGFYINLKEEEMLDTDNSIFQEYCEIGEMKDTIMFDLVKTEKKDNMVSFRFHNSISSYIDTFGLSVNFEEKLLEQGYNNILESELKKVYENDKYQVILIKQFDYLIVVIVGK